MDMDLHYVANFVNWRSFTRIDRKQQSHLLLTCCITGDNMLFSDLSQSPVLPPMGVYTQWGADVKTPTFFFTRHVTSEQRTSL